MHSTHFRHQLYLHGSKIVVSFLLLMGLAVSPTFAQINSTVNLPNFDEQHWHYGFLMGLHTANYRLEYVDDYVTPEFDTLHSVVPPSKMGFKIGFIVDYHIFETLDVRLTPTVGFNQLQLNYRYTNGKILEELRDPTYVELPILLKYKSVRRRNRRMYFLGGINPSFKAASSKEREDTDRLLTKNFNLSVDVGIGMDLYQPLFKFSPEIRYSFGLLDVLAEEQNDFSAPLQRLTIHSLAFYITFEGGPSTFRRKGGKYKR
ncbi:type IX secretion/gliding motility protein PorT/SprT [Reichenbachiella ulvae]|uniref:PorT family protein n=1 Tax=Reichenbachiella ulvae TaxID=2980104 RepID=A0ABT3CYL1_9BACT|nr:porin family protein [Reichenbachiella ulvae]MCV9388788.1 PorT family protein [Reichenbachiella ulvae]